MGFCKTPFWCRSLPPEKLEVMPLYPSKTLETNLMPPNLETTVVG